MVVAIKFTIMVFVMLVWAGIGLLFWVPLLARIVSGYSVAVFAAAFGRGQQDLRGAGHMLDKGARFYIDGFRSIWGSVWSPADDGQPAFSLSLSSLVFNTIYTILFWIGIVFLAFPNYWTAVKAFGKRLS